MRAARVGFGSLRARLVACVVLGSTVGIAGCSGTSEERTLPSIQVGMDQSLAPIYDDDELALYEVRLGVQLPILAPSAAQRAELDAQPMSPYGTAPWVRLEDVRLQLSWTLTNLDVEAHNIEVLVDPWNEFAKYFPGLQLVDAENGEYLPNLSGIDYLYAVQGSGAGEASRRHGTFTFDDLDEMARDFATAMNLIDDPPMSLDEDEDLTVTYVNHAFAFQNHSERDLLVKAWLPPVVPGLTGFDIALRTFEPAKVAIEVVAEVVDTGSGKVLTEGRSGELLEAPAQVITVGTAAP
jgi:hypothetical protein